MQPGLYDRLKGFEQPRRTWKDIDPIILPVSKVTFLLETGQSTSIRCKLLSRPLLSSDVYTTIPMIL
jgi:hypothetical protein